MWPPVREFQIPGRRPRASKGSRCRRRPVNAAIWGGGETGHASDSEREQKDGQERLRKGLTFGAGQGLAGGGGAPAQRFQKDTSRLPHPFHQPTRVACREKTLGKASITTIWPPKAYETSSIINHATSVEGNARGGARARVWKSEARSTAGWQGARLGSETQATHTSSPPQT